MNKKSNIHFISGLPRSGSTLLSALLKQNPRFHADISSPLAGLLGSTLHAMGASSEASLMIKDKQKPEILKAIMDTYARTTTQRDILFDTNRGWCAKMPLLNQLAPNARVIVCVRNISWIMDSFERIYRKNPFEETKLYSPKERGSVCTRVDALFQPDRIVGSACNAVKEAFYGEYAHKLLIVDYKTLTQATSDVLKIIYQFIQEPWYEGHDFNNVEFDAPEVDQALGAKGLHKVKKQVKYEERKTILPPDIFERFSKINFWYETSKSRANVILSEKVES
jgi:sulfotransferase